MRLTKWQPGGTLNELHDEFDRMFERFFGNGEQLELARKAAFTPNVDVVDRKNEIVVRCELPGLEAKDIDITCDNGMLVLTGEKRSEHEEKRESFYRFESQFGKFQRVVELPGEVRGKDAKATFKNGVLEIVMPKSEDAKAKEMKIKIT